MEHEDDDDAFMQPYLLHATLSQHGEQLRRTLPAAENISNSPDDIFITHASCKNFSRTALEISSREPALHFQVFFFLFFSKTLEVNFPALLLMITSLLVLRLKQI